MTDLDKALAAARAMYAEAGKYPVNSFADRSAVYACISSLKVLIDALDAARGEAVAWYRPSEEGYDSAFRDASTVDRCDGHDWAGWVPLYATPPAEVCKPCRGSGTVPLHVGNSPETYEEVDVPCPDCTQVQPAEVGPDRDAVAKAICVACDERPNHAGDCQGNAFRWQDYLPVADAAIAAMLAAQAKGE